MGTPDDDVIHGLAGNDSIISNAGKDTINGSTDDDLIVDADADEFVLRKGHGTDTISNFDRFNNSLVLADGLEFEELAIKGNRARTSISLSEMRRFWRF